MAQSVDINGFLLRSQLCATIDVRSPGEFAIGHIPGAINVPLFNDAERTAVGTAFKKSGRDEAVLLGLELVGPRMREIAGAVQQIDRAGGTESKSVCLHCWRGGMRSQSVAWLLEMAGFQVTLLEGGYKSWRQYVRTVFARPWEIVVLSGLTGAGKTLLLHRLGELGEQAVDLEQMANHRGSAFGGLGLPDQPTVEQFENCLASELAQLDPSRRIWVEDEGRRIGRIQVPVEFYDQYRIAPAIYVDVPLAKRAELLAEVYGTLDVDGIVQSIENIRKRLGGQHANEAIRLIRGGNIAACTELLLEYYDRTYLVSKSRMPRTVTHELATDDPTDPDFAMELVRTAEQLCQPTGCAKTGS